MIGHNTHRGFTLLIAVILASVATALGAALASIAYKSISLSSVATNSQYAFYAADSALECGLFADSGDAFDFTNNIAKANTGQSVPITCMTSSGPSTINLSITSNAPTNNLLTFSGTWFTTIDNRCARITVTKKKTTNNTFIYAEGISTCNTSDPNEVERGIYSNY